MIRAATPSDLNAIYRLCAEGHKKTVYSHIPSDEYQAKKVIASFILSQFAWVTDSLNGVLLAGIKPPWYNTDVKIAGDLVFYVRDCEAGQGVRLLKEYIGWGTSFADVTTLSVSIGEEAMLRAEKLYERMGFLRVGGEFLFKGE